MTTLENRPNTALLIVDMQVGVVADRFKNLGFKAPQRSNELNNLYFVGGSVNPGGGMPMVTLSGQLVRDKILADLGLKK